MNNEIKKIDPSQLTETEKVSYKLLQNDFSVILFIFLYFEINKLRNLDFVALNTFMLPYASLVTVGAENWLGKVNEKRKKNNQKELYWVPFMSEQKMIYDTFRESTKFWSISYETLRDKCHDSFDKAAHAFQYINGSHTQCNDFFTVYYVNDKAVANSLFLSMLHSLFDFEYLKNKELDPKLFEIIGNYVSIFGFKNIAKKNIWSDGDCFNICHTDYGGKTQSTLGQNFSDKYLIHIILCQINFLLYVLVPACKIDLSSILRFTYLQYYYLRDLVNSLNEEIGTSFQIDGKYYDKAYRDAMAHYKVGMVLRPFEIKPDKIFYGITQKLLNSDERVIHQFVLSELKSLSDQLTEYLGL